MDIKKELESTSMFQEWYSDAEKHFFEAFQGDSACEIVAFSDGEFPDCFLDVFYFGQSEIGKMYRVVNPNETLRLSKSEKEYRIVSQEDIVKLVLKGTRPKLFYSTKKGMERLEQLILAHEEKNRAALESFVLRQIVMNCSYLKLHQIANLFPK